MSRQRKPRIDKKQVDPDTRLIGYARVSTPDQDLKMQVTKLKEYGVHPDYIFVDKLSGKTLRRPGLQEALAVAQRGDVLIVWRFDRLSRALRDMIDVLEYLHEKGVDLKSLQEPIDTRTAMGRMLFHFNGMYAEFERAVTAERTAAGLSVRKREGVKLGRDPSLSPKQVEKAVAWLRQHMDSDGELGKSVTEVAEEFGCNAATVRNAVLAKTGEKLWPSGPWAGKRRKRKRYTWAEIED